MKQSPTNERPFIVEIKVDVAKHTKKNCEYVLKVLWSDDTQYRLFRRYSMFFDLQAGLKQLFESRRNITMPILSVYKAGHAGRMLFGAINPKKQCKAIEEFCEKIIKLPPVVSQCDIVEKFFSQWATDAVSNGDHEEHTSHPPFGRSFSQSHGAKSDRDEDDTAAERFRSVAQFLGKGEGEMSLDQDEIVSLIEKNQTGWWLVLSAKGEHGFAPATFLEPVEAVHNTDTEEWTEVSCSDRFFVTMQSYTAQSKDEISYDAGEEVELVSTSDFGWWKIRCKGCVGLAPASHLGPRAVDSTVESGDAAARDRSSTYSSISGIYASIKSPPPRRGSSRNKADTNPEHSKDTGNLEAPLQYASVEIATSPPRSPSNSKSTCYTEVLPRHLRGVQLPNLRSTVNKCNGRKQASGSLESLSPSSPCPPATVFINALPPSSAPPTNVSDSEYATVRDPTARGVTENVRLLGSLDAKKRYFNVQSDDGLDHREPELYTAVSNYSPPPDCREDLALSVGTTVRLVSSDGPWFFVDAVHLPDRRGWVPSSVLKPKVDELSCLVSRRSLSVGDITMACKEEEASAKKTSNHRAPVPLPRKDLPHRSRIPSPESPDKTADCPGRPSSGGPKTYAPPLPGEPIPTLERTQALTSPDSAQISARYVSASNYFPTDANCVSFRKGDSGVLLEVNKNGWWRMSIDGIEGWTPGNYWERYQENGDQSEVHVNQKRMPIANGKSVDSETWFQGKMTRQGCEELMTKSAQNLEFLVRESAQKFASFALSVKYMDRIRHFPIELTPSHRFVIGRHVFNSLEEIVTYYKSHPLFFTRKKDPVYLGCAFERR